MAYGVNLEIFTWKRIVVRAFLFESKMGLEIVVSVKYFFFLFTCSDIRNRVPKIP